ncbi:MAG TPA: hypothetical protein VHK05_09920 [Candidatus Limnocylindrales bacterium]|jgi:hypothetical protein|nr:hypothetical protein [Candidatus Limnocylindrales bacterium]
MEREKEGHTMLKILVALVLLAHGIGHVMGPLQVFKVATINPTWAGDSWVLTGVTGQSVGQAIGVVLWIAALIGFAALAGVVLGWLPAAWWAPLAIVASTLSLMGIALFPTAFPLMSTVGAVVVDIAVLASVLWFHWAPADIAA